MIFLSIYIGRIRTHVFDTCVMLNADDIICTVNTIFWYSESQNVLFTTKLEALNKGTTIP